MLQIWAGQQLLMIAVRHMGTGNWMSMISISYHIMVREGLAVYRGLLSFLDRYRKHVVEVVVDNAAVAYGLRKFTSGSPELMSVLDKLFWLCEREGITIRPKLIKSELNEADYLSRWAGQEDWQLSDEWFDILERKFGPHTVDRFASVTSAKLPRYNSLFWDPKTEAVDAFTQDWSEDNNYGNPPWSLIGRVVSRLKRLPQVAFTLVVPDWPSQSWYVPLMLMAKEVLRVPPGHFLFHHTATHRRNIVLKTRWPVLIVRVKKDPP